MLSIKKHLKIHLSFKLTYSSEDVCGCTQTYHREIQKVLIKTSAV